MKVTISCLCLLLAIAFAGSAQKNAKPSILIILTDDQGYHDVSYYGTRDLRTPNIDMLCRAGMRFDNFYANSPVCSPTRASLLSGRYPEMVACRAWYGQTLMITLVT